MALHAHPVRITLETLQCRHGQPGLRRALVIRRQPAIHPGKRPAEESILEQADRVICDRPPHAVLEIQHRQVRLRRHQVARHEVTMGQHLRLLQRIVHQSSLH